MVPVAGAGQLLVRVLAFWRDPSGTRDTGSGRGSKGPKASGTVRVGTLFRWQEKKKFISAEHQYSAARGGPLFLGGAERPREGPRPALLPWGRGGR